MKVIHAHGRNLNNTEKYKVGSIQSHSPETTLLILFLYILLESLPFERRMSIIIFFYLKTLFHQKFSTSWTGLIPPWPERTWITIVRVTFEREEPKYIPDQNVGFVTIWHRSDSRAELCLEREVQLKHIAGNFQITKGNSDPLSKEECTGKKKSEELTNCVLDWTHGINAMSLLH